MANFQSVPSRAQSWKELSSFNAQRAASTRTLRALHAALARSNSSEQRSYTTLQAVLIAVAILILTPAILVVLS